MTTVKTLLDIPALRLRVRAGGDLLDRAVTRIYGTELADPGRYVSAGEFVLSGLLWWKRPGDAEPFVAALAKAGAAALAASGADTGGIPGDLIEACARHRIPLLEAPADLSFAVITERVVLALAAGSHSARKRLLSVAAEDASLDALVGHGSAELGAPCWVLSATGRVVAGSDDPPPVSTLVHRFVAARGLPTHVDDYELTPIGGRHAVPWLLAVRRDLVPAANDVIDELAGLIGLARSRDDEVRRVSDRIAEPLIELLAGSGDPAGAFPASGLSGNIRVLVARTPDAREGRGLLADLLADHPGRVLLGESGEDAYALIEDHPSWPADWTSAARRSLSIVEPLLLASRVLIGIGGPAPLSALRGASEEARHAVTAAGLRPGVVEVVAGEQVGMHRLLLAGAPDELRSALRQRVLGPLLDYDAEQHGDLVHTIRVYLECSSSPARAAKALHVHVNTLRYRVAKASELLGVDLTEFTQQVDVYLALKAES
ncbi:PucR family transcriptional regulator ligand-binding domain-containing protein [Amycolatopsis sp. NPDC059657]|uniref:helix-turn-helix domain-containing protein n=1 Tax=Amycolatopsis sp. NPDC059657 TaxID=3346899 RepID=UPI00366CE221